VSRAFQNVTIKLFSLKCVLRYELTKFRSISIIGISKFSAWVIFWIGFCMLNFY